MDSLALEDSPFLEEKLVSFVKKITPRNEQLSMLSQSSQQLEKIFQDYPMIKEVLTLGQNVAFQLLDNLTDIDFIVLFVGDKISFPSQKAIEIIEEIFKEKIFESGFEKISYEHFLCYKFQWEQFTFRIAPAVQRSWFKNGYYCVDYHNEEWRYTRDRAILIERLQWCDALLEGRLIPLLRLMRFCQVRNKFEHPQAVSMIDIACNTLQVCPNYRYGIERLLFAYCWIDASEYLQLIALSDHEFMQYFRQRFFSSDF